MKQYIRILDYVPPYGAGLDLFVKLFVDHCNPFLNSMRNVEASCQPGVFARVSKNLRVLKHAQATQT